MASIERPYLQRSVLSRCLRAMLLAAAALLGGCHELRDDLHVVPADGEELPILRQSHGAHCHETRAMQLVIRDTATLARVPLADVAVDFSREMLLVVTLGRVTSDQYSVNVDRVWRDGPRLRVATTVDSPPPGAKMVMASPYCIAVVPKCELNVAGFSPQPPTRTRSWQQSEPPAGW